MVVAFISEDAWDAIKPFRVSVDHQSFYTRAKQLAEKGFVLNDTGPQGLKPD